LPISIPQPCIPATNQHRQAIFHHRDKFIRSLSRIQRNDNQTFRHDGQIQSHPSNPIVSQKPAPVPPRPTTPRKKTLSASYQLQQFAASDRNSFPILNFLKNNPVPTLLQGAEN